MNRIRTKMVLGLLAITLLPVIPVYFLVKNLLETSREIGFNQNVESALEQAAEIARELYAKYRDDTLDLARSLAAAEEVKKAYLSQNAVMLSKYLRPDSLERVRVDFYDNRARLLSTLSTDSTHVFPILYQNKLKPLTHKSRPQILDLMSDRSHIVAAAPVQPAGKPLGFVVVTKAVPESFTSGSQRIVEVNQIFKTLQLMEGSLTRGFVMTFFAIYAPIALLSIVLGYYFSHKITRPLLDLVEGTKRVAAGDWLHRVQVQSKDEVGDLIRAFNDMVATLKEQQDQVIALEKMAVWREIARILAHEIKNPLTPIQLTVQQMKDQYAGEDPEYRKLLDECSEIVSDEIESLRTLVREFSDFARMPGLNLAPANLNELVEEVSKLYKDRSLNLQLDPSLPEFDFDYEKMRRVLINLIENGLDSMQDRPDGQLTITTQQNNDQAVLQVADTGSGIPKDLQQKIFEPYFSTKKSGVGLGLAIVKRIVEEHGGKIVLESKESKGTTFTIFLPVCQ